MLYRAGSEWDGIMNECRPTQLITELADNISMYTGCAKEDALAMAQQFYEQLQLEYTHAGRVYGTSDIGLLRWMVARLSVRDDSVVSTLNDRIRGMTMRRLAAAAY